MAHKKFTVEDFFARMKPQANGCIDYTGRINARGYGRFAKHMAHRFYFELQRGPIPAGLTLDHLCRNPRCVNPAHLEPVTKSENSRRKTRPTACPRGHEYTPDNTYVSKDGSRNCKACNRISAARYKRRKMEKTP